MADLCQAAKQFKEKFTSFEINHVLRVCMVVLKKFLYGEESSWNESEFDLVLMYSTNI